MSDLMHWTTLRPILAVVLGAIGTYLLLPQAYGRLRVGRVHLIGGVLTVIGVALLAACYRVVPQPFIDRAFFYAFAIGAIAGGILMITSRNPVYSALWFAAVVLSTCGLFLLSGAQFLAAGTIIVYAGAIIVTFLFVIMLAQATGQAAYDRASRSPMYATLTSFLLLWSLLYALISVRDPDRGIRDIVARSNEADRLVPLAKLAARYQLPSNSPVVGVLDRASRPTARIQGPMKVDEAVDDATETKPNGPKPVLAKVDGPPSPHVAGLGGTLYTDHLIVIEVAGAILFIALVGTAAIATPRAPIKPKPF